MSHHFFAFLKKKKKDFFISIYWTVDRDETGRKQRGAEEYDMKQRSSFKNQTRDVAASGPSLAPHLLFNTALYPALSMTSDLWWSLWLFSPCQFPAAKKFFRWEKTLVIKQAVEQKQDSDFVEL